MQSRRNFIKTGSLAFAGLSLSNLSFTKSFAPVSFDSKRPPIADRKFISEAIESKIIEMKKHHVINLALTLFFLFVGAGCQDFLKEQSTVVIDKVYAKVLDTYKRKVDSISQQAYPVLKDVYERMSHQYENVVVPISDGVRVFQVVTNLKATAESEGRELARSYEKTVVLATIDDAWKENLRELDELKHSVQNASYEQKDPLLIFKLESVNLFDNMVNKINNNTISVLTRGQIPVQEPEQVREAAPEPAAPRQQYREEKRDCDTPPWSSLSTSHYPLSTARSSTCLLLN